MVAAALAASAGPFKAPNYVEQLLLPLLPMLNTQTRYFLPLFGGRVFFSSLLFPTGPASRRRGKREGSGKINSQKVCLRLARPACVISLEWPTFILLGELYVELSIPDGTIWQVQLIVFNNNTGRIDMKTIILVLRWF